jgi:hypothetical protein
MMDTQLKCYEHISLIQQQMESEFHQKVSMYQAIAIWLSEGLEDKDFLNNESNDYQFNILQG